MKMSTNIKERSSNKKEAEGLSHFESHSIIYTWRIDEITSFLQSAKTSIEIVVINSPKFSADAKIKDSWCLQMKTKSDDDSSKNNTWISLYLSPKNGNRKVRTKYSLFLVNAKNEKIARNFQAHDQSANKDIHHIFLDSASNYGYRKFIEIDELIKKNIEFYPNDILTICVDLTVYDDYVGINNSINSSRASKRKLSNDFGDLFAAKKKCDIKIQIGKRVFDAHKLILTTRSCVFDAMFSHNMKENKKNKVNISDVDPEVFKRVLQFIYTDNVDDLDDFAEQLLEVSDKYQLEALKELCEDFIAKALSVENSIRILVLADRHSAKQLFEFVLNYIVINLASLKDTEEYKALEESHPSLFLAVLKRNVDRINSN